MSEQRVKQKNENKFIKNLKRVKWGKVILIGVVLSIIIVASFGAYFAYSVYQETANFDVNKLTSGEASKMYDQNGELIYTFGNDENGKRENITYEDLPQVLVDAIVAGEDSRFFEHDGFDLPRIIKSALTSLAAGRITGGGSTITQQVIKKSYFPAEERTFTRKLSEVFLSMEATKEISKEEILTLYLNKIYFGNSINSIGIAAASKYYFNKEVQFLTLPEAALLAGTLNSPSRFDPYYNLDSAKARRDVILGLMLDHGYITQQECDGAKQILVQNMLQQNPHSGANNPSQAYIDLVTAEVIEKTGKDPRETQMNIYTFLNSDIQKYASDIVTGVTYDYKDDYMNMAGSIQSTLDGRIVAVMGGRNYQAGDLNLATVKRQPGSSIKPILDYGMAYKYLDWCTQHTVEDKPFTEQPGWDPTNYDGSKGKHGKMTIADALLNSWNLPAIWTYYSVLQKTSSKEIHSILEDMGIDMTKDTAEKLGYYGYAIGGWESGTSPIELATAYSTVANNGKAIESHTINYIDIVGGEKVEVDKECQENAKQALDANVAFMIRETQLEYVRSGGSYSVFNGVKQLAAKTGTSTYSDSPYIADGKAKDIWVTAYNPDYAVSVWMGYDLDAVKLGKDMTKYMLISSQPASMIMKYLNRNGLKNSFPAQPSDVVQAQIVKGVYPYTSPTANTPADMILTAWFKKGTTPTTAMADLGINQLASFDASIASDGRINVNFSAYDPINATTDSEATQATQLYGKVVYVAEVTDISTGALLHSATLNTNSATLDYIPTGRVNVNGYYTYENSTGIKSNIITKAVGKANTIANISYSIIANGAAVASNGTISGTSISVKVTPQSSDSIIEVSLLNSSGVTIKGPTRLDNNAPSCTISALSPNTTYRVKITETIGDLSAPVIDFKFTTAP